MPQDLILQLQNLLQGRGGLVAVVVLLATTLLFLVLWLTGRGGGKDRAETERLRKALRTAETELKLRKGDLVEANRELETLRALAGGRVPPELEKLRTRAEAAEASLEVERERHKKELELLSKRFGLGSLDPNKTAATPSTQALLERAGKLEQELAEARRQLAELERQREAALKDQAERLGAEHAAALTALTQRHQAALAALRSGGAGDVRPLDVAGLPAPDASPEALPFLEPVGDGPPGPRRYLPFATASIGREEGCTIVLPDPEQKIGRRHAEIVFDGQEFRLRDRNSVNGTFVNEQRVASATLAFGDVVGITDSGPRFRFACAAFDRAASDPAAAIRAYEAMLGLAPGFAAARAGLEALRRSAGGGRPAAVDDQRPAVDASTTDG